MNRLPRGVRAPAGRMRIVALAAVVVGAFAVIFIATHSSGTYEVTAVFDDTRGLIQGGEVRAGGLKVGTVEEIGFTDDRLPEVRMRIDSDYELRQGAFANIRLASNVGVINRFVDLSQGEGPPLGDGATLGPSHTDQPVDFDLAVSTLDPKTRREIGSLLANLDRATRGRGDDLAATLRHSADSLGETANLLAAVTADGQALRTLVEQGRTVVGALASDPNDLAATADRLASVLTTAAGRQQELRRSVDAIGPGLASAHRTLDRFSGSIGHLRDLITVARPAVAQLGPLADALRPVAERRALALGEVDEPVDDADVGRQPDVRERPLAQLVIGVDLHLHLGQAVVGEADLLDLADLEAAGADLAAGDQPADVVEDRGDLVGARRVGGDEDHREGRDDDGRQRDDAHPPRRTSRHAMGRFGLKPQKTNVMSMFRIVTTTKLAAIDWAVATPTSTGPPRTL